MRLKFTKMHGLGNDFMVVDGVRQKIFFSKEMIRRLADRHFGVGFDQLLLVEPPYDPELDFHYRIFNADGEEVQMCGNGARCFVRFVTDHELCRRREIKVSTMAGRLTLRLNPDDSVTVNMGHPVFDRAKIPLDTREEGPEYHLEFEGRKLPFYAVSMGNPHAVFPVSDIDETTFKGVGELLQQHPLFPERVNVGFVKKTADNALTLRVFERGCGETLACGSGACAAAVTCIEAGLVSSPVKVTLPGGTLEIAYRPERLGGSGEIIMTGPATRVYEGSIEI